MLGLVPGFFANLPGPLLDSEWENFKSIELSDPTAMPNKYKELIGIAVSGDALSLLRLRPTEAGARLARCVRVRSPQGIALP